MLSLLDWNNKISNNQTLREENPKNGSLQFFNTIACKAQWKRDD
jgi:hypothetical protein